MHSLPLIYFKILFKHALSVNWKISKLNSINASLTFSTSIHNFYVIFHHKRIYLCYIFLRKTEYMSIICHSIHKQFETTNKVLTRWKIHPGLYAFFFKAKFNWIYCGLTESLNDQRTTIVLISIIDKAFLHFSYFC